MSDDTAAVHFLVSADGKDWRDVSPPVQSVEIEDHDTLTDQAKLVLEDNTGLLAHASFEGLRVRLGLGYGEKTPLIFEGVITGARIVTTAEGQKVEITAHDYTHYMTKFSPEQRTWKSGKKLSDVIKEIVGTTEGHQPATKVHPPYGLFIDTPDKQIVLTEDVSFSDEDKLSQQNQSDWDFLKGLADRHLAKVFVEYNGLEGAEGKSNFYFVNVDALATTKPIGELTCCRGAGDLVSFSFEKVASGALKEITASGVEHKTGKVVTHKPEPQAPAPELPAPETDGKDVSESQRKSIESLVQLSAASAKLIEPEKKQADGGPEPKDAKVKVRQDPLRLLGYKGSGVARGDTKLRAKSRVTITGVSPWAAGDWYLRKVNHKYSRTKIAQKYHTSYSTTFEASR